MKNKLIVAGVLISAAVLIVFAVWWQVYRWQDCRRVGHTWFYCLMTADR